LHLKNDIIYSLENIRDILEKPLYDELESGFRHSPLTNAQKISRYQMACEDCLIQIQWILDTLTNDTI